MFSRIWWIRSNIALDMIFPKVIGLEVIAYSVSIRDFLKSCSINYFPWLYTISIGIGYLDIHVVSTNFAIVIALLSSYYTTSTHPVTGSIILTDFICNFYFLPLHRMTQSPIRYTHILFHGISSANWAGNLPYFLFDRFVRWQVSQSVTSFRTAYLMLVH